MALTPDEQEELTRLEHALEEAGGRGVELTERIDDLRAKRDAAFHPDTHVLVTSAIAVAVPRALVDEASRGVAGVGRGVMAERLVTQALEQLFNGEGMTGHLVAVVHESDPDVYFDVDDYPDENDDPLKEWR